MPALCAAHSKNSALPFFLLRALTMIHYRNSPSGRSAPLREAAPTLRPAAAAAGAAVRPHPTVRGIPRPVLPVLAVPPELCAASPAPLACWPRGRGRCLQAATFRLLELELLDAPSDGAVELLLPHVLAPVRLDVSHSPHHYALSIYSPRYEK